MNHNEKWSQGQTANTSIGQGYVLASPLQMAMVAATVANGGTVYKPSIVYEIQEPDGTMIRRPEKIRGDLGKDNNLSKEKIELVCGRKKREANNFGGTGTHTNIPGFLVVGQLATAKS